MLADDLEFLIEVRVILVLINPLEGLFSGASVAKSEEKGFFCDSLGEAHLHKLLCIFLVNIGTNGLTLIFLWLVISLHFFILKLLGESKRFIEGFLLLITHYHILRYNRLLLWLLLITHF